MNGPDSNLHAREILARAAADTGLDVRGGTVRRTSSRFCLGIEHGDYNGTALFGVGTDRFLWLAYKPNDTNRVRLFSANFPHDGIVDFQLGHVPPAKSRAITDTWARFPYGVDFILRREGFTLTRGFDAVLYGNIPGGGMSRSASLDINLLLTFLDVNAITLSDGMKIVGMAQAVENDYIGSPSVVTPSTSASSASIPAPCGPAWKDLRTKFAARNARNSSPWPASNSASPILPIFGTSTCTTA